MHEAEKALELIKQHGIFGLGGYDGCMCTNFEVWGIHVDISCRKSSGSSMAPKDFYGTLVRVWSRLMDKTPAGMISVATEIIEQVRKNEGHLPIRLRFCDYEHDKEMKCTYCGKPRETLDDYICSECKTGKTAFGENVCEHYDYGKVAHGLVAKALIPVHF